MILIHEAIIIASWKHNEKMRKGSDIPYFSHPAEVMQILTENESNPKVIVAGILHDTLEDIKATPTEILERFR